jgi:hypothetical protein
MLAGVLLPPLAVICGLWVPRTLVTSLLVPAVFAVSGALIGRWWAPLPSLVAVAGLSLGELLGISHSGATIELHAGGFDLGFLVLTLAIATVLAVTGGVQPPVRGAQCLFGQLHCKPA